MFEAAVADVLTGSVACIGFCGTASGSIITAANTGAPPDTFATPKNMACPGCTVLAQNSSGLVTSTNGAVAFTRTSAVYTDPGNVFGAGDLDFAYQVSNSNSSADSVGRVTGISFTFSTGGQRIGTPS